NTVSRERYVTPLHLGRGSLAAFPTPPPRRARNHNTTPPPRLRTRNGEKQKHREIIGEDAKRARRATVNRTWTVLRAALNHAFREGKVDNDLAWRNLKPFRSVDAARVSYI